MIAFVAPKKLVLKRLSYKNTLKVFLRVFLYDNLLTYYEVSSRAILKSYFRLDYRMIKNWVPGDIKNFIHRLDNHVIDEHVLDHGGNFASASFFNHGILLKIV